MSAPLWHRVLSEIVLSDLCRLCHSVASISSMLFATDCAVATREVNRHGIASQRFRGDVHTATQVHRQVQRALLLNVVVRQSSHVFTLSSSDDSLQVITLIMVTTFLSSMFLVLAIECH